MGDPEQTGAVLERSPLQEKRVNVASALLAGAQEFAEMSRQIDDAIDEGSGDEEALKNIAYELDTMVRLNADAVVAFEKKIREATTLEELNKTSNELHRLSVRMQKLSDQLQEALKGGVEDEDDEESD